MCEPHVPMLARLARMSFWKMPDWIRPKLSFR